MPEMAINQIQRIVRQGDKMDESKLKEAKHHLLTVRNYIVNGEISGAISDACNAIDDALGGAIGGEVDPFAELKAAYADGKTIQFRCKKNQCEWIDIIIPTWHPCNDYRIKPESEKYCGLTEDQWKVVIDGGYLVEYGDKWEYINYLEEIETSLDYHAFTFIHSIYKWKKCRPRRASGHVQPVLDTEEFREYWDSLDDCANILVNWNHGAWSYHPKSYLVEPMQSFNRFIVLP